jgi:hypothetical protein
LQNIRETEKNLFYNLISLITTWTDLMSDFSWLLIKIIKTINQYQHFIDNLCWNRKLMKSRQIQWNQRNIINSVNLIWIMFRNGNKWQWSTQSDEVKKWRNWNAIENEWKEFLTIMKSNELNWIELNSKNQGEKNTAEATEEKWYEQIFKDIERAG